MNTSQEQVMEQVKKLLGEHFDAWCVSVAYDATEANETLREGKAVYWGGGAIYALGCAEYGKQVVSRRCLGILTETPGE